MVPVIRNTLALRYTFQTPPHIRCHGEHHPLFTVWEPLTVKSVSARRGLDATGAKCCNSEQWDIALCPHHPPSPPSESSGSHVTLTTETCNSRNPS